ncbi:MAG: ester cyclase [Thaumarchaeota archaeon]|nr:ester cyclase [Nitrososphaerota archaeon]
MSEKNKTILRRYGEEIWSQGNLAVIDELVALDVIVHLPGYPQISGLEAYKQACSMLRAGFPDLQVALEDIVAEGDKIAGRWTFRGTQTGDYMGIAATGKPMTWTATAIYRITDGKVAEVWDNEDFLGLMQQLGVISK